MSPVAVYINLRLRDSDTGTKNTAEQRTESRRAANSVSPAAVLTMARERQRSSVDVASWCCVLALVLVVGSLAGGAEEEERGVRLVVRGERLAARPCEELYVVAEGETLHSISARCGDPYILERNPHVHDPDDVFPGLVIKITPRAGRGN